MSKLHGVIVLDGADCSGKTTLARHLVERYGAKYIHSTVRKNVWKWHLGALRLAHRYSPHQLVVLDRHWLSEMIYGSVYRNQPAYDLGARCFDRALQALGCLTILCSPLDQQKQLKRHAEMKETRKEHFTSIQKVTARYADLRDGNLAHPGTTYLDQLIRYGDYTARADVSVYDLDRYAKGGKRFETYVHHQVAWVQRLRENAEMLPTDVIGNVTHARYLFVGERLTSFYPAFMPPWPFFWNDSLNAASWFNGILHELAFDETRGLWANAEPDTGRLDTLKALRPDLRVITLGDAAEKAVAARHWSDVRSLSNPLRCHRRWAYVADMKEALRV